MEQILHAGREQYSLLSNMLRRPELFVPMMGIWVASFGGALHGPVTTYFQVELGASTEQIGNFGVIRTIGVLLVSPLYGWLLDRHSAYTPAVLSAFCCTFGCLFHGFAQDVQHLYLASVVLALGAVNFWNVVGAYVALATPREQRHVVVTGFQVQVSVLRLLGTSLYPFVDSMLLALGVTQKLLRYRIHMSECSLFCVVAFVYLVGRFQPATWGEEVKTEAKASEEKLQTSQLALLLTTSVVQSFGETVVTVLWPLHLRKLHLGSHDLAWLQLSSQLLIILSTLGYPPLTRLLGHRFSASALPLLASLCSALAFLQPEPTWYGQAVHVVNVLSFLALCGTMKVCYQHLATLAVPAAHQGRIFSLLNVLSSLGNIFGNLVATRLAEHDGGVLYSKGSVPWAAQWSGFYVCHTWEAKSMGSEWQSSLVPISSEKKRRAQMGAEGQRWAILQTLAESPGGCMQNLGMPGGVVPPPPLATAPATLRVAPTMALPQFTAPARRLGDVGDGRCFALHRTAAAPAWTGVITVARETWRDQARNMAKKTPFRAALIQGKVSDVEADCDRTAPAMGALLFRAASEAAAPVERAVERTEPAPRWLRAASAAVVPPVATSLGRVLRPQSSLVFARCSFTAPSCPDGPAVVVERALVDTGSSDCELREGLLKRLPPLPVVARGVTYETSTGDEAYDAYEVVLTVNGRRCAAVLTVVPEERFSAHADEPCSDEALLGHMAIAALGLDVHCRQRSMLQAEAPNPGALAQEMPSEARPLPEGELGQLHVASSRPYGLFGTALAEKSGVHVTAVPVGQLWTTYRHAVPRGGEPRLPPRWLPGTGCAVPLCLGDLQREPQAALEELDPHGKPVVPVTYATCHFLSPLSPDLRVSVKMALVDTGSSDCELSALEADRLGRLPTVAQGVVYETVCGRHVFDSYEVLLAIEGRVCACAVTGVPEERFHVGAEDPASDEAVLGLAALSALDLVVHCRARAVAARRREAP
ncbi:Putative WD repeat-containing protein [Durusdinium trenchii]|uniref:WD repeat-containing protein n=1 Tax=Durusdinium trenchii TaxID=1381693 RepID=A0ABP0S9T1_9DINO